MGRFTSRAWTPIAAALMVSFMLVAPANAAPGDNSRAPQAQAGSQAGGSEQGQAARDERAAGAQGSAARAESERGSQATAKPAEAEQPKANEPRSAEDHASKGTAATSGHNDKGTVEGTRQPLSKADRNQGGANGQCDEADNPKGTYCATPRTNEPAPNGAGDGKATGKPCAGCVGKADNKNPKGQLPDAKRDGNRGYECDDNKGIGVGNPAHTGCEPSGTITTTCPDGTVMTTDGTCVELAETCPDGAVMTANGDCVKPTEGCPAGQTMVDGVCVEIVKDCPTGQVMTTDGDCVTVVDDTESPGTVGGEVLGEEAEQDDTENTGFVEDHANPSAEVLGVQRTAPTVLPQTGAADVLTVLMIAGLGMATAGALALLFRRRLESSR